MQAHSSSRRTFLAGAAGLGLALPLRKDHRLENPFAPGFVTGRAATLVVAAADASAKMKGQADFVCDGMSDQAEINAAIDSLPGGGSVYLSEGHFILDGAVWIKTLRSLVGTGPSSILTSALPLGCLVYGESLDLAVRDLAVEFTGVDGVANALIYIGGPSVARIDLSRIKLLFSQDVPVSRNHGIFVNGVPTTYGKDVRFSGITSVGASINGQYLDGLIVEGCRMRGVLAPNSPCIAATSCIDSIVQGNSVDIRGAYPNRNQYGIDIGYSQHIVVMGNTVRNGVTGIYLEGDQMGAIVMGNPIHDVTYPVYQAWNVTGNPAIS